MSQLNPDAVVRFPNSRRYEFAVGTGEILLVSELMYSIPNRVNEIDECQLLAPGEDWKQGRLKFTVNIEFEEGESATEGCEGGS